jgi:hypothetical protein
LSLCAHAPTHPTISIRNGATTLQPTRNGCAPLGFLILKKLNTGAKHVDER